MVEDNTSAFSNTPVLIVIKVIDCIYKTYKLVKCFNFYQFLYLLLKPLINLIKKYKNFNPISSVCKRVANEYFFILQPHKLHINLPQQSLKSYNESHHICGVFVCVLFNMEIGWPRLERNFSVLKWSYLTHRGWFFLAHRFFPSFLRERGISKPIFPQATSITALCI